MIWPAVVAGVAAAVGSLAAGSLHRELSVEVALASMTTFLFGVLLAFTIARTRERLVLIRELMSEGNAALQSIHQMMAIFPEPDRSRIRDLVDVQLTTQIDYRLVDNHLANPAHDALVEAIYALDPGDPPGGGPLPEADGAVHPHGRLPGQDRRGHRARSCSRWSGRACSSSSG